MANFVVFNVAYLFSFINNKLTSRFFFAGVVVWCVCINLWVLGSVVGNFGANIHSARRPFLEEKQETSFKILILGKGLFFKFLIYDNN